jgi:hypothetical protein
VSRHPAPDRHAHRRFCDIEGWLEVASATGAPVRHHATFELTLADGSVLRTRISRPVDRTTYAPSMWAHILRDQLEVTADAFWDCVQRGAVPARSAEPAPNPRALPLHVLHELVTRVGMSPDAAASLTLPEATAAIARYWHDQP